MVRSLLPWVALAVVVLAALAYFVREPSRADVGLDVEEGARIESSVGVELASAAEGERGQRAPESVTEAATPARPSRDGDAIWREHQPWGAGVLEVLVVHDEDGRPFAGALVGLPVGFDLRRAAPDRTTDADGLARFENLIAGAWTVVAEAEGFALEKGFAHLDEVHPAARIELRLTVRRDVLVRFVDPSGGDLAPGELGLDDAGDVGLVIGVRCGEPGGEFVPDGAPPHRARNTGTKAFPFRWILEVRGSSPMCVHALLGDIVIAAEPVDPRATSVLVRVDRDAVRRAAPPILVRVVTGTADEPVEGAVVSFRSTSRPAVQVRTDAEGRARADDLVSGTLIISARADGFVPVTIGLRRPIEAELVLRLFASRKIAGVLLDQTGAPMSRAHVVAYPIEDPVGGGTRIEVDTAATDLAGRFEFAAQEAGRYMIVVQRAEWGWRPPQRSEMPADSVVADCRTDDATGIVVRGVRVVNDVSGPEWNPPPPPPR